MGLSPLPDTKGALIVARIVSFVVLVAILLVFAVLFFQVMADFLVPLFLALMLVIMFGPLHRWFKTKCKGHDHVAAGLTTFSILLIVLVPICLIFTQATLEGFAIYDTFVQGVRHSQESKAGDVAAGNRQPGEPEAIQEWFAERVVSLGSQIGLELKADEVRTTMRNKAEEWLEPLAIRTTKFFGRTVLGLAVMIIALYFFLVDGPGMIHTLTKLAPLDEKYEEQLIDKFDDITRSVVVALLLAAFVQGILAGIGYYFAGVGSVFLLMALTMLLAMVPFLGAASVWISVCLWLLFFEQRTVPAIILAIYGASIVSTIDNVIKTIVLHGRSKLHPLLALLSVIGGLKALGLIGIFVGPMAVAFLQVLLNMLNTELDAWSKIDNAKAKPSIDGGNT
jgi:predicted PurR-regulated permease PerM